MKILQVIDNLYPGGAERVFVNLCNWLDKEGVDVIPVVISGQGLDLLPEIQTKIAPIVLGRKGRLDLKGAKRMAELMEESDIVHVHMRHNFRYVHLIKSLFGLTSPVIFHDHFGKIKIDKRVPIGFKNFFKADAYIGVSMELVDWARVKLSLNTDSIFLLQNAIETEEPNKKDENPEKVADLVLVSNIKNHKNQGFGLKVAQAGGFTLHFIGNIQDEAYYRQLEDEVQYRKMEKQVRFLHNVNNVQQILHRYRLGIHTSVSETGPLTIIEYLAQGLPFVAFRTGEAAEKIAKEFPEFFLDSFELGAWLDRIQKLLYSPPDKQKMKAVFDKHFSKESYISKCLKIYQSVQGS